MLRILSRLASTRARAGVGLAIMATTLQLLLLGASLGPGVLPQA